MENYFALSPIDGRYEKTTSHLKNFLSEAALIHYRLKVELLWLEHLLEAMIEKNIEPVLENLKNSLLQISILSQKDYRLFAKDVKEIEKQTNHDVKSCEYFLQELFDKNNLDPKLKSFIHFGCTSEDINNLAYGLMLKDLRQEILLNLEKELESALTHICQETKETPLLSRTHGQAASPTTLGKEIAIFLYRLKKQRQELEFLPIYGKINGAVGNYNAHKFTFPETNWPLLCQNFVEKKLNLNWNPYTTQIESHDGLAKLCQNISLTSTISIGLCQDIWSYISVNIFGQKTVAQEVGSSTMPHKVNPIDFENAEGNFGIARNLANHMADKLPISRKQRDLSDSTVQRSLGTLFGHYYLAKKSLLKGLKKITPREDVTREELENHWEVLAEPIQMILRRYGVIDAYEKLKEYSRGKALNKEEIKNFVETLNELPEFEKKRLLELTPATYTGLAEKLTKEILSLR